MAWRVGIGGGIDEGAYALFIFLAEEWILT